MTPIVIFGAAVRPDGTASPMLRRRVAAALRFGRHRPDALYIPTGAQGRFGEAESSVMAALLMKAGVPRARIREEPTGTDTLSSARAVLGLLPPGVPIYVATSRFHLARCVLLLRLGGARARPVPVGQSTGAARWYWRLREVPAIPYDALLMLWHRMRD